MAAAARPLLGLAAAAVAVALLAGCVDDRPAVPRVSRDPQVQTRFALATKVLGEIERRRRAGKEIYGDCKMARALFLRELRRSSAEPSRQLAARLTKLCAGAARAAGNR